MTFIKGEKPKVITSAKALDRLTEPGFYRDHEVKGLGLRVVSANNRSWVLRYQIRKRSRNLGLGPYPLVGLSMAREKARAARLDLLAGIDPLEKRREAEAAAEAAIAEQAKVMTFKQAAERYFEKHAAEWKSPAQARAFRAQMSAYAFPILGAIDVAAIDMRTVLRVLTPIWESRPRVAAMVRQRIEKILTLATVSGYRSGDNPAVLKGRLDQILVAHAKTAPVKHHAALDYKDVPGFMKTLREQHNTGARALEFIVLTACRKMEGLHARWDEIDRKAKVWTIPAARMKTGDADHVIPLSDAAMALLENLRETDNPYVFAGRAGSPITDSSVKYLVKRLGVETTIHGFRSAFRDWAGDKTTFPREVCEAALSHAVGDQSERSYRRGTAIEKRRALMQQWADFCDGKTSDEHVVIEFRGKAK